MTGQPDQFSPLIEGAIQLHEWFHSLLEAGFTETQAIGLMAAILRPEPAS